MTESERYAAEAERAERVFLNSLATFGADADETANAFRDMTIADAKHVASVRSETSAANVA